MRRIKFSLRGVALFLSCAALFALFSLAGCSQKYDSAKAAFLDFSSAYGTLPVGKLFLSAANEWEKEYLSEEIIAALYTDARGNSEFGHVADCAVYLGSSLDTYYELAIFICYDNSSADSVARMCATRLDAASRLRDTVDTNALENAIIEIHGRTVIMSALPDAEATRRALAALLK